MANDYLQGDDVTPQQLSGGGSWWDAQPQPVTQMPPAPSGATTQQPLAPGQVGGFGQAPGAYTPPSIALPNYQAPSVPTFDKFVAPTAAEAAAAPGTQFGLQQAQLGSERSAAAKGSVLSGGFQKELGSYLENVAQGYYGNTFNQKLQGTGFNNNAAQTGFQDASQNAGNIYSAGVQNYNLANQTAQNAYGTNYNTSRNAANDYYQALLDQQKLGQQAGTQAVSV
jgi:hypothetical protein